MPFNDQWWSDSVRFRSLLREFPGFDLKSLPLIPPDWIDSSDKNDGCPSFVADPHGWVIVYIRDKSPRYVVEDTYDNFRVELDDWSETVALASSL